MDASINSTFGDAGIAAIVRDDQGKVLMGKARRITASSILVAEAEAMLLVVDIVVDNAMHKCIFETDSQVLYKTLTDKNSDTS